MRRLKTTKIVQKMPILKDPPRKKGADKKKSPKEKRKRITSSPKNTRKTTFNDTLEALERLPKIFTTTTTRKTS